MSGMNPESKARLHHINGMLELLNEKLNDFQEQLESASGPLAFELRHRIEKEIKPSIKQYEDERDSLM